MNIQQAKEEIARTFSAYMRKRADGTDAIPKEKQRPLLLVGPPGIGKTAIMRQVAEEQGLGLVSYAMTHHTRQSAIGLPFIVEKEYGGRKVSVTEYTMSEIVASIYDYMEKTGHKEGILFLDEINCVSETLTPVMLQLLQNKTFGTHPLPPDWIIAAAGNPPEYNRSAREFDMVTLDRVKYMEIEADLSVWQTYAAGAGIHPAIRSYLTVHPEHFYNITNTDRGQLFVTARGWEDLSLMLSACEEASEERAFAPDAGFFLQYLQHDEVAASFALYYKLFREFTLRHRGGPAAQADTSEESPAEESFAKQLLRSPDALREMPAAECLSVSAMLGNGIAVRLRERAARLSLLGRIRELTSFIPAGEVFRTEEGRNEFFAAKKDALAIHVAHRVIRPAEEFRERKAISRLEGSAADWILAGMEPDFKRFENDRLDAQTAAAVSRDGALAEEIEDACRVLSACREGRNALLYLVSDLSNLPEAESFLRSASAMLPLFVRYKNELLSL